jgi:hypothetical protein
VIVCNDGSSDRTSERAAGAGAIVVSHSRNRGKAAAVESAVNGLGVIEQRDKLPEAGSLLLLDADLAESAANCAPLIDPVVSGEADLTIAVLPAQFTDDGGAPGGFGLVVTNSKIVQEATKLFDADLNRQAYSGGLKTLIVSPVNARSELTAFIKKAKKQLWIYDPKIGDPAIVAIASERACPRASSRSRQSLPVAERTTPRKACGASTGNADAGSVMMSLS